MLIKVPKLSKKLSGKKDKKARKKIRIERLSKMKEKI